MKDLSFINKTIEFDGDAELAESDGAGYKLVSAANGATVKRAEVTFSFEFEKSDAVFLNGYQSWTLSRETPPYSCDKSMKNCPAWLDKKFGFSKYGDGHFYKKRYKKGIRHGYSYAYISTYFSAVFARTAALPASCSTRQKI